MNKKQQEDIELAKYFIPSAIRYISITVEDELKYLEWSEQGLYKKDIKISHFEDGFNALVKGKKWQGIHIHELWEPGVLEGTVPYFTLLGGEDTPIPRSVVNLMKREMFKGEDSEIIENVYNDILLSQKI